MVQQGLQNRGAIYGLRSVARARHAGGPLAEDLSVHDAAEATVRWAARSLALPGASVGLSA